MKKTTTTQVKWKQQLVLALSLTALGAVTYWLEGKRRPEKEASEEQAKKVFAWKEIETIRLVSGSKKWVIHCADPAAKLCKAGDSTAKWELLEPSKLKADHGNVNSLISSLSSLSSTETIDLKEETPAKKAALLKEYGLDPEARVNSKNSIQLMVRTSSGESTLFLGKTHPIGESLFAIKTSPGSTDDAVLLLPSHFKSNFEHDLTYWRNKKLFSLTSHEIDSFQLDTSSSHFDASRKDGQWVLRAQSEDLSGDVEKIDGLLAAAIFLTAKNFPADSKADPRAKTILKGIPKLLTLTLHPEKGTQKEAPQPISLEIFHKKTESKAYAWVSNQSPLFELDASTIARLEKSPKDLRVAKLVNQSERFGAILLRFEGPSLGDQPIILTQASGKWVQSNTQAISQEKVQDLLDRLAGNRIQDFLEYKAPSESEKAGIKFTLGDAKSEDVKQILFWKEGTQLYARDLKSKKKEKFLVDATILKTIPWDKDFFRLPTPTPTSTATHSP